MVHALTFSGAEGVSAVGLSWQHEENLPEAQSPRKLARQLEPSVRWGAAFKNTYGTFQSVLCEPTAGVKPSRAGPLAATAATAYPQPWAGPYHLGGEHYRYIAARQGQVVIAGGDQAGTLSELAAIRVHHQSLLGWIEIEDNLDDLANLAHQATSMSALHDVQSGPWRTVALAVTATTLVVETVSGGWHLYDQQQEAECLAAQARQKAVAARKAAAATQ